MGDLDDSYRAEYPACSNDWRFLVGLRFAILAFAATLLSALLGAYQYILTNVEKLGDLGKTAQWALPVIGILITLTIILIEERTRNLYVTCLATGKAIEAKLELEVRHYTDLQQTPYPLGFASHTLAIRTIYLVIVVFWLYLLTKSLTR